jgi:phosphoribosyl-dephospho-CoA transferase
MPFCRPMPHDLVWCDNLTALDNGDTPLPPWVETDWHPALPLVVRRAPLQDGRLPVGIRGKSRAQRHPLFIRLDLVQRSITPQCLAAARGWRTHPRLDQLPPLLALISLAPDLDHLDLDWGITGGAGFELACGWPVLRPDSDLDLSIRCPHPVGRDQARHWLERLSASPCRVDAQIETPGGAFALAEWLRDRRCLLKTDTGPLLVADPWHPFVSQESFSS